MILTDDELGAAAPEKSRLIEITDFVDLDQIDPVYFFARRTTWPPRVRPLRRPTHFCAKSCKDQNKVAIGTMVMRNKEYPVAIRPGDEVLKLETMYFADEVRSRARNFLTCPTPSSWVSAKSPWASFFSNQCRVTGTPRNITTPTGKRLKRSFSKSGKVTKSSRRPLRNLPRSSI